MISKHFHKSELHSVFSYILFPYSSSNFFPCASTWLSGRATGSCSKGPGFESREEQRENFLLRGQVSVLTLISVSKCTCVTAVAPKRFLSFCQNCRRQVTAKLPCMHPRYMASNKVTLKTDAWMYGVHRTCAETAAVSRGTSKGRTKYRCKHFLDIQKLRCVKIQSLMQSRIRLERRHSGYRYSYHCKVLRGHLEMRRSTI